MPHDHPHHHHHGHGHHHPHPHDHNHAHGDAEHMHSHIHEGDAAAELQILSAQFIEGFREAKDKMSYLRIAGVPLERDDPEGGPSLKLVDVKIETDWQVGTASPSFGSRELSYLPFTGEMVTERTNMGFLYVSIDRAEKMDLRAFLRPRIEAEAG